MSKVANGTVAHPTNENNGNEQQHGGALIPRVDVLETENEYLVLADMPGTMPEEVDVRFEQGELSVHGRRGTRKENFATYHRTFAVADTVAADNISADLKAGVLTIRLPKVEVVKPRKIAVNG
jgi:HSP20 family protein